MAKKPDIGSKQFSKLLEQLPFKPNKILIKRIDSKMFAFDQNKVLNFKPEYLAFQEYKRCLELFIERNPGLKPEEGAMRIAGIQSLIVKNEEQYRDKLQRLAIETIREIYQVPDYVNLAAFINPRLNLDTEQNSNPESFLELTLEQKNKMRDEIQKRIVLNSICHGSSMHVWKGIFHLVAEELDKINPDLKELYNYYTSTLGIALWIMNPDMMMGEIENNAQLTQGLNKLNFNKEKGFGGNIEARGINFPVLLHEINKGVIDWLISAGIPKEYTEDELKYYYAIGDSYSGEIWHYLLSPTLWVDLLACAQLENQDIPKLIARLTKMSYQDLVDLFRLMYTDKLSATKTIQTWNI